MNTLPILAALLTAVSIVPIYAGPIGTYVFSGSATGTIGSIAFTNAALTITASADVTTALLNPGIADLDFPSPGLTIAIAGIGTGTLTGDADIFVNYSFSGGTIGVETVSAQLAEIEDTDIGSTIFASYNLQSSLGPIGTEAADPDIPQFQNISTSIGSLTVSSYNSIRFQALVGASTAAPEPGGLALIAIGMLVLGGIQVRQKLTILGG
jgi:hypothetical protein